MKALARDVIVSALYAAGVTRPRADGRLNVVTFHRVLPPEELADYPLPGLVVSPDELDWFLNFFKQHFECGALDRLCERWESGSRFERPPLAVTFDDALGDNFRHAKPVLDGARVRATFFVPTEAASSGKLLWHDRAAYVVSACQRRGGANALRALEKLGVSPGGHPTDLAATTVERLKSVPAAERDAWIRDEEAALGATAIPAWDRMMSFDEIARLFAEEHEIGSHSHSHPILTRVDDEALKSELHASARVLESCLKRPPTSFCYPNGDADERVARATEACGYRRAVTTAWGSNPRGADRYRLRRFDVQSKTARSHSGALSPARLAFRLSGLQPAPK
jgi:peptidoglycan/xylan/chitin deacetylase (PgdA/CDA1 family)